MRHVTSLSTEEMKNCSKQKHQICVKQEGIWTKFGWKHIWHYSCITASDIYELIIE